MVTSSIKIFQISRLFFAQQICQLKNYFQFLYNRNGVRGVVLKWRERERQTDKNVKKNGNEEKLKKHTQRLVVLGEMEKKKKKKKSGAP